MASERILICDCCGKKGKKDCTGWISLRIDINLYDKKGYYWYKKGVKDDFYLGEEYCGIQCFDASLNSLVLDGSIASKVYKMQKRQNKE